MNGVKITMILVLALLLVPSVAAAPIIPDSGGIDAEGVVESYVDGVLTVNGVTFTVNDATLIITGRGKGNLASLDDTVGVWASVNGYTDAEGTVVARKVKIKPWENKESESDAEPEDEDNATTKPNHPVAMWISKRFELDYDKLMAMHEAGIGWGNLVKAYHLAQVNSNLGITGEELLDMRLEGKGWGNITRELGTYPGKTSPAWGRDKDLPHPNPNAGPKK